MTEWQPPESRGDGPAEVEIQPGDAERPDARPPRPTADADCAAPAGWLIPDPNVERIDLDGRCWVDVVRGLVDRPDQVHDDLIRDVAWEQGRVFRYERWIDEPRLGGWQARADRHPALAEAQDWISHRYQVPFDGVALARYRDGRDSQGWHRDRELKWLDDTVIGVLTLGARRSWLVRPLTTERAEAGDLDDAIDLAPTGGDLLVMGGATQRAWLHAVPKTRGPVRSRISAQWRWTSRRGAPDLNPSYYAPRTY